MLYTLEAVTLMIITCTFRENCSVLFLNRAITLKAPIQGYTHTSREWLAPTTT